MLTEGTFILHHIFARTAPASVPFPLYFRGAG